LTGADKMKARLKTLIKRFPDEVGRALYIETGTETTEVKRRTPVDKGTLRASIHQVGPIRNGRTIYTLIVAGGPAAPYAIFVHEDLDAFHKVGQAKYIESVILESRSSMGARVAKRIDLNRALAEG
jgi:hypothetical protein